MKKKYCHNSPILILLLFFSLFFLFGCPSKEESTLSSSSSSDSSSEDSDESNSGQTITEICPANSDPLCQYQWHLENTGQTTFADTAGTVGEDINLSETHLSDIKGNNVKIAILDTGLEITHEDLVDNVESEGSWDFIGSDTDPTNSSTTGDHGTSVTGLIGSVENNGKGGKGVAPKSTLVGS